jgi:hypothetical protein
MHIQQRLVGRRTEHLLCGRLHPAGGRFLQEPRLVILARHRRPPRFRNAPGLQMSDSTKSDFDSGNLLSLATLLIGLAAAWLYVAGRTYAYHYYGAYHLGLIGLGIPQQDYLVFGAWVIRPYPITAIIWFVVVVLVAWGIRKKLGAGWMLAWLVAAVVVAFQLAFSAAPAVARRHVEDDRRDDYQAQPMVSLMVDPAWAIEAAGHDHIAAFESGCYRLLVVGDQRLVLLRPFRDAPEVELATTVLRWESVRSLNLLPPGRSCSMELPSGER